QVWKRVANLLARPMAESKLDKASRQTFAANLLVSILQTIGRGMRKGMPVSVYFVDAAWAPQSARGLPESGRSSLLVKMRDILNECLTNPHPDLADIYGRPDRSFGDASNDRPGLRPRHDK